MCHTRGEYLIRNACENTVETGSLQSLAIVRQELVATIEQAAQDLETAVAENQDNSALAACIEGVKQILGVLKMLEFRGAVLLVEELLQALNAMAQAPQGPLATRRLEQVSDTFFVLMRYLEYIQQSERKMPVLLIPFINDLRKLRREPVLPECHFFILNLQHVPPVPACEWLSLEDTAFKALLGRMRHLYQIGLLGVLRNMQIGPSMALMRRALLRLQRLGGPEKPLTQLWWLAQLVLAAMAKQSMVLIESRKMLLSRLDRVISQVQQGGPSAYLASPPKGLIKELVYLLAISGQTDTLTCSLLKGYGVPQGLLTDAELAHERQALRGPSQQTVQSLSSVLQVEIASAKSVLEQALANHYQIDDVPNLNETLAKIAEILSVVGLKGPSLVLKAALPKVRAWAHTGGKTNDDDLEALANTLLYLESAVQSLEHTRFGDPAFLSTSEAGQHAVVAFSELNHAERLVLQEAHAGLALVKSAVGAFTESGYEAAHILNLPKILTTLWGAMVILNQHRAAACLFSASQFVDGLLHSRQRPAALEELLETFADALVSMEYFLDTAPTVARLDSSVLKMAEESLAALGYTVKAA